MDLTKYRVVNTQDEEYDHLLDSYREAVKVAEYKSAQDDGEPWAVMELTFEYSDTSLEYSTNGSQVWPPPKYGVTWATPDHSIGQTGFVTFDEDEAIEIAIAGPWEARVNGLQVDSMCSGHELGKQADIGYHLGDREVYGLVQMEDGESVIEVRVGSGVESLDEEVVTKP